MNRLEAEQADDAASGSRVRRDFPAVVFFLSSEWARYHRPGLLRAVAKAMKGQSPVLVVNNPVCCLTARWHRPERWRAWQKARQVQGSSSTPILETVADNLVLLDAAVPLHDRLACSVPGAGAWNRRWMAAQVQAAARHLNLPESSQVNWFQFPTFHHYAGMPGQALAVYECYDEHADVPGLSAKARRRLVSWEQQLMQRCDVVFTTSKPLFDAKRLQHREVRLSYNAADPEQFAAVAQSSLSEVEKRRALPPTVGYLGTVHEHTDLALLADVAERQTEWRFLLIGPVQPGADAQALARLKALPHVTLKGWVESAELPSLLSQIDVGVIPYRRDALFNRFVNPNKLHEYTAMGKPVVVSTGLDVSSHGDEVVQADGANAFIQAIAQQHQHDSVQRVMARLQVAALNSWDVRAKALLGHIEQSLSLRAQGASSQLTAPSAASFAVNPAALKP